MQRTQVWSLVLEDSTCREATKPMSHNYGAHELQILKPTHPRAHPREATTMRSPKATMKNSPHSLQLEKVRAQQLSPSIAKNNFFKLKKKKKKESSIDNLPLRLQESPYLGFGFQIFLPKELSFFLTANFEFKEGAGTFILPETWIIVCFIKRNAGLHCRLREVCRGHLFWQGSTFSFFHGPCLVG